jgi:predicted nucleotidyltransferase
MTNTLITTKHEIEPLLRLVYSDVQRAAEELELSYLVVGASARDLVLHNCYGIPVTRQTKDVDFAINVPDWANYHSLKSCLTEKGYVETPNAYRLMHPNGIPIDIVPFGGIANTDNQVALPPKGEFVMQVLGFSEALEHAEQIQIHTQPQMLIPVVSTAGLVLLKLVAWLDRDPALRQKDAEDIAFICEKYEGIPGILDQLYEQLYNKLEPYQYNTQLLATHLLGKQAAMIANQSTRAFILPLFETSGDLKAQSIFKHQLGSTEFFNALAAGFLEGCKHAIGKE